MKIATSAEKTCVIGARRVGSGNPVFLIAEIGSNHDGSLERAKLLIKECAAAGADAVKFQSFTADGLYVPRVRENGQWKGHPTWKALKKFELPLGWLAPLSDYAQGCGVQFMSTPFDSAAVAALERVRVPAYKIASGDITHIGLIREVARTGQPVLIATGTGDLMEARRAVDAVLEQGNRQVGLFHCVSMYPPRIDEMNLRAIETLIREFGCPVGLSDHGQGHDAALGAVALGATMIEKHVTLDRSLPGPDHPYALLISEFAAMGRAVRNLEQALGDGVKRATGREVAEMIHARRGLYAAKPIRKGATIGVDMVKAVRPALGMPADDLDRLLGSLAARGIEADEPFEWSALEPKGET